MAHVTPLHIRTGYGVLRRKLFCWKLAAPAQALGTGSVQTDLVTVGVIEIGVFPSPGHLLGLLRELHASGFQTLAETLQVLHLEVQTHAAGSQFVAWRDRVQSNRRIAARRLEASVDAPAFMLKVFEQLESKAVRVEPQRRGHISGINHGMVER